ncbi:alpha/beta-type small acid-soluble spore protein [Alicyclobacillus curvatus]|nr:alpha/beta-type small acid-soluble spore protein [Alicyclobacillus curvatus]
MATQQQRSQSSNQRLVPLAESALDQMKYEIASEFGVVLGGDTTSRENGSVGGEMTKRMVAFAEGQMAGRAPQITH